MRLDEANVIVSTENIMIEWYLGFMVSFFKLLSWMFQHDCLDTCCFECLICMCFVFLYLPLFITTEHVSHGKAL